MTLAAAYIDPARVERERCKAILTCEAAKGRETLAHHLAFKTNMSADKAVAALKVAPIAQNDPATDRRAGLHSAMTRQLKKMGLEPKH
jgi:hypothetical protein